MRMHAIPPGSTDERGVAPLLERRTSMASWVRACRALIEATFDYFKPNRRFLAALMSHAADPSSPLSPFSEASRGIRDFDFAHFERALLETKTIMPADMAPHMPGILWMYETGLLLFWIYDGSKDQRRSRELLEKSLGMVIALLRLSNVPLLKPVRRKVLEIVRILES
jgi:AcrR family transcriptional regulator